MNLGDVTASSFQPYEIRGMSWPKSMGHRPEQTSSLFTLKPTITTIDTLPIFLLSQPSFSMI